MDEYMDGWISIILTFSGILLVVFPLEPLSPHVSRECGPGLSKEDRARVSPPAALIVNQEMMEL